MTELKEFFTLLEEGGQFPKDELRDYYLVPAKALLNSNPHIVSEVHEDKTVLMAVVEQIVKKKNHSIRTIHLNSLAMDIIEKTPKNLLNFQNKLGNSVVHISTEMECFSVGLLDLMKECGANFSLINKNGETPLILIADSESLDDVKFIHAYTNPKLLNHRDFLTGSTALMKAVLSRRINNIFFLLESGASLFVKNNQGKNVIEVCAEKEYKFNSEMGFYKELEEILQLFSLKQKAEQTLKKISLEEI